MFPTKPRYENAAATAMPSAPLFPDRSALELVTVAQQEFDVGHDREWAATLWAATQKTFLDLAKAKSIDSVDLIDIAESLDQEDRWPRALLRRKAHQRIDAARA